MAMVGSRKEKCVFCGAESLAQVVLTGMDTALVRTAAPRVPSVKRSGSAEAACDVDTLRIKEAVRSLTLGLFAQ
jgi:hypothetical protein